jgi:signal transduction histidine kinase
VEPKARGRRRAAPAETPATAYRQQLESLYSISIEIARLHEMPQVLDRALGCCLELTRSAFGFIGLLNGRDEMDVAAIKGFEPSDPDFYDNFRLIPVRPSVFGVVITDGRSNVSNDVLHDPDRVGQPRGHPPVRTFMGVPLQVGERVMGMIGVANKPDGYTVDEERLLSTFANQVAVAIENARLYGDQRRMIDELEVLHRNLSQAEREQVLRQERERIAAELHDRIEQAIFTLGLKVNAILERGPVAEPVASGLGEVRQLAIHTSESVREAIFALSLPRPAADGLLSELQRLVRQAGRSEALEADLVVSGRPRRLGSESEQTLYTVAGEALSNVVRHARARRVLVSLRYSDDHVDLVIQDDGVGASEQVLRTYQDSGTHFGMKRSRRRVEDEGGSFEVGNGEESGFAVRARLPVPA